MREATIGIIGLGLMGESIARACLKAGYRVKMYDTFPGSVQGVLERHPEFANRAREVVELEEFAGCELIIEAIVEKLEPKLELFRALEKAAPGVTIASNSSTFMPGELAIAFDDPTRLLVLHFFNPADTVPLVEIVPGASTDPERLEGVREFAVSIGKTPVVLRREIEGFVANRLQAALLRECLSLVDTGIADAETVDTVVRLSLGPRWAANGPIATADLGGLDVFEALFDRLFPLLDNGVEAPSRVRELVARGAVGAKSGAGIYEWPQDRIDAAKQRMTAHFGLTAETE